MVVVEVFHILEYKKITSIIYPMLHKVAIQQNWNVMMTKFDVKNVQVEQRANNFYFFTGCSKTGHLMRVGMA